MKKCYQTSFWYKQCTNSIYTYLAQCTHWSECEEDFACVFVVAHPSVCCSCLLQREGAVHWYLQRPTGEVGEYVRGELQEESRNTNVFFFFFSWFTTIFIKLADSLCTVVTVAANLTSWMSFSRYSRLRLRKVEKMWVTLFLSRAPRFTGPVTAPPSCVCVCVCVHVWLWLVVMSTNEHSASCLLCISQTNQAKVDHPPVHCDTLHMLLPVAGSNKVQNHIHTYTHTHTHTNHDDPFPRASSFPGHSYSIWEWGNTNRITFSNVHVSGSSVIIFMMLKVSNMESH